MAKSVIETLILKVSLLDLVHGLLSRLYSNQGSKQAKLFEGFRGWFRAIFTPIPPYAKYFLTTFTLISEMIKFDLSGADFSPRAEKLEPW